MKKHHLVSLLIIAAAYLAPSRTSLAQTLSGRRGRQSENTRKAVRSRRDATRIRWTNSMSLPSLTPSASLVSIFSRSRTAAAAKAVSDGSASPAGANESGWRSIASDELFLRVERRSGGLGPAIGSIGQHDTGFHAVTPVKVEE